MGGTFTNRGNAARLLGSNQGCCAFKISAFSASPREIGLAPHCELTLCGWGAFTRNAEKRCGLARPWSTRPLRCFAALAWQRILSQPPGGCLCSAMACCRLPKFRPLL